MWCANCDYMVRSVDIGCPLFPHVRYSRDILSHDVPLCPTGIMVLHHIYSAIFYTSFSSNVNTNFIYKNYMCVLESAYTLYKIYCRTCLMFMILIEVKINPWKDNKVCRYSIGSFVEGKGSCYHDNEFCQIYNNNKKKKKKKTVW